VSGASLLSCLGAAELLSIAETLAEDERSDPTLGASATRAWHTVAATEEFEAFVITWPVGGAVDLHDHGDSAGAVIVVSGSLVETVVGHGEDGALVTATKPLATGARMQFAPGHVHDIANLGPAPAVSIHVYSPVLSSMTFFEPKNGSGLVAVRTEDFRSAGSDR
jgi:predicted metal-dependent enzyme (double-stranded beta helix superfamily)